MSDHWSDSLDDLQNQIFEETRLAYGETVYARWRNPLYMGELENPSGQARVTGTCGDTMQISLVFEDDRVSEAAFLSDGCGSSVVCGSFAAELARGKSPDELVDLTGEKILDHIGGLPEEDRHCAFLAAETVQEALSDYLKRGAGRK